jgi:Na+-translocating ferredoxin:NAD+ oxidoreductase subunit B
LFEDYFQAAFSQSLAIKPQFHRIVPVGQSIRSTMEVRPFETAADLVNAAQAWAVQDCICRKQKALIGDPCKHPVDICMVLSSRSGAFDGSPTLRAMTHGEALATLRRAADAGLVHSVSNNQRDVYYICNCCTCSCAILRGMAKLGKANVVASSAFVNQVDETLCIACEECISYCQFDALTVDDVAHVKADSCVGCGVCVLACPSGALGLVRRPPEEVMSIPVTMTDWNVQRSAFREVTQ